MLREEPRGKHRMSVSDVMAWSGEAIHCERCDDWGKEQDGSDLCKCVPLRCQRARCGHLVLNRKLVAAIVEHLPPSDEALVYLSRREREPLRLFGPGWRLFVMPMDQHRIAAEISADDLLSGTVKVC